MNKPAHKPARYLVLIEAGDGMVARLFDADRRHLIDFDASSFEVVEMTAGRMPVQGADQTEWRHALDGHDAGQLRAARVYTLDP